MKAKRSNLKPASGTAQVERFPLALDPAYAPVDQRECADLLAFALDFAKLLAYYDEQNQHVSDWSPFFRRDITFLLARICTTDFQREHFDAWGLETELKEGKNKTKEILKKIYQVAKRIDDWYIWAKEISDKQDEDSPLKLTLESIIEADLKRYLGQNLENILKNSAAMSGSDAWDKYWKPRETQLAEIWRKPQKDGAENTLTQYKDPADGLIAILRAFNLADRKLSEVARTYLEDSLHKRSNHPPHTALYIAFAKLMDLLRERINTVTGRHLDFYYRDVLKLSERGSTPDVAHLSFTLAPTVGTYMLPAGTRLTAGKDANGKVIEYATETDLPINRAKINSLRSIYVAKDRFADSAQDHERVVSIFASIHADSEDGQGAPLKDPAVGWPTFGLNEAIRSGSEVLPPHAELGFLISSPALLLQEGERQVKLTVTFSDATNLEAVLQTFQSTAAKILDITPEASLLLADSCLIYLSGEKGWMPVSNASFRRHAIVGTALEIEFTLEAGSPAVIANPALAPDAGPGSLWPLLKLMLNPAARIYPYSFLKSLIIETVDISVQVRGMRQVQLQNELGPLDPAQPFMIFGPSPSPGSYLLLAHRELAVKQVSHATITIGWFNLPKPPDSLTSHYRSYDLGIDDNIFKVRVSVFAANAWAAQNENQLGLFPLFTRDYSRSAGLLPISTFPIDVSALSQEAAEQDAPMATENQAAKGSIRIELAEPAFAFGHAVYPRVMAEVATGNALAGKNGPRKPLPNPPIAPLARSLSLDYEASDKLTLKQPPQTDQSTRFYHIHPFGHLPHHGRVTTLFPLSQEQGHLYLGIENSGPRQVLTLLFQIRDAGHSPVPSLQKHLHDEETTVRWRYLANGQWKDLPASSLVADSTMGLTRSGIVKLYLPGDITTQHTLMPEGLCWIEAAGNPVADAYWCHIVTIDTQAVTAVRICNTNSDLMPATLPAGSITQLSEKLPQIKTVSHLIASSGARNKERPHDFYTRVSERLRHKNRAIQPSDFERMILNEFPEVGQVKCIGPNNSRGFSGTVAVNPGLLYLVVTPLLEECPDEEPRLPQFVLKRIENFIHPHTSPSLKDIHVINPVYESLKVFVNVVFAQDEDGSYYSDSLNKALSQYLLPWRKKPIKAMPIGSGQVQGHELALFIKNQKYIKRLDSLAMLHTFQTEAGFESQWLSVEGIAMASAPWAVLIPIAEHGITALDPDSEAEVDEGIKNLTVGEDFVTNPLTPGPAGRTDEQDKATPEARYFFVIPRHAASTASRPERGHD